MTRKEINIKKIQALVDKSPTMRKKLRFAKKYIKALPYNDNNLLDVIISKKGSKTIKCSIWDVKL